MIHGCTNGGCVVRGETGGQHTNGICRCVEMQFADKSCHLYIQGVRMGSEVEGSHEARVIATWLRKGGLRDILALERKGQNKELAELRKMVDDYQLWLDEARSEIAKLNLAKRGSLESFPMEAVMHLSRCSCHCQRTGPDVEANAHLASCMVGQAQVRLGMKVTKIGLYKGDAV